MAVLVLSIQRLVHGLLKVITNPKANMDVPLALKDIGIRQGLKGYTRKSSSFYRYKADVVGFLRNMAINVIKEIRYGKIVF